MKLTKKELELRINDLTKIIDFYKIHNWGQEAFCDEDTDSYCLMGAAYEVGANSQLIKDNWYPKPRCLFLTESGRPFRITHWNDNKCKNKQQAVNKLKRIRMFYKRKLKYIND